jgi:hypothetical protein
MILFFMIIYEIRKNAIIRVNKAILFFRYWNEAVTTYSLVFLVFFFHISKTNFDEIEKHIVFCDASFSNWKSWRIKIFYNTAMIWSVKNTFENMSNDSRKTELMNWFIRLFTKLYSRKIVLFIHFIFLINQMYSSFHLTKQRIRSLKNIKKTLCYLYINYINKLICIISLISLILKSNLLSWRSVNSKEFYSLYTWDERTLEAKTQWSVLNITHWEEWSTRTQHSENDIVSSFVKWILFFVRVRWTNSWNENLKKCAESYTLRKMINGNSFAHTQIKSTIFAINKFKDILFFVRVRWTNSWSENLEKCAESYTLKRMIKKKYLHVITRLQRVSREKNNKWTRNQKYVWKQKMLLRLSSRKTNALVFITWSLFQCSRMNNNWEMKNTSEMKNKIKNSKKKNVR